MANFDTNSWYQIVLESGTSQSFDGSYLYDAGKGSAFFKVTNTSDPEQQWQIWPVNNTYVFRTEASGSQGYLCTKYDANETTPGSTTPYMANSTFADDSMFWKINPWNDGSYALTNKANGTNWQLIVKNNSLMAMTSNISAPATGQHFVFKQLGSINNSAYSSLALPSSTATSKTSTATTTSTSTSSATTSAAASSGLSTGAKAGIGAGVGVLALILLAALGFFLMKRRRSRSTAAHTELPTHETYHEPQKAPLSPGPVEADATHPYELDNSNRPAELPTYHD